MKHQNCALLAFFAVLNAYSQTPTTVRVANEVAPPGGMAQMKLLMTSPMPILTGFADFDLSGVSFASVDGINLFSPTGDVAGAAVLSGGRLGVTFVSPQGTFGTSADYPMLTAAIRLNGSVFPGQVMPVKLNGLTAFVQQLLGPAPFEYKQGAITVAGTLSITDVIPGGGVLAAGSTFRILGMGFSPKTQVAIRGIAVSSIQYVSAGEIRVTVKKDGRLDGVLIQVKNPDGSSQTYYSYMRGVLQKPSTRALLARTTPIFPMNPAYDAVLPPTVPSQLNPSYFTAIAVENSGTTVTSVTIDAVLPSGAKGASAQVTLAPQERMQFELSELFGFLPPLGTAFHVTSPQPVQMLGLLGNDTTGSVLPIPLRVISAPTPVPIGK